MNMVTRFSIAAAAIAVVAVIGINLLPGQGGGPGAHASPSPRPSPTPVPSSSITANPGPTALPITPGPLAAGTYVVGDPFVLNVGMTVGDDWNVWAGLSRAGGAIYKDSPDPPNGKGVIVTTVDSLYANACEMSEGFVDPGPTTEDLAAALAKQPRTIASPITDVTLAGYTGTYVEYVFGGPAVPGCETLDRWYTPVGNRMAIVDEADKVWILDVDGVRLVIDAFFFSGATAADHAEVQAIVESIKIEP